MYKDDPYGDHPIASTSVHSFVPSTTQLLSDHYISVWGTNHPCIPGLHQNHLPCILISSSNNTRHVSLKPFPWKKNQCKISWKGKKDTTLVLHSAQFNCKINSKLVVNQLQGQETSQASHLPNACPFIPSITQSSIRHCSLSTMHPLASSDNTQMGFLKIFFMKKLGVKDQEKGKNCATLIFSSA